MPVGKTLQGRVRDAGNNRIYHVPRILRDVGEDDGEVYVIGVRESDEPDSWSLMFMECFDAEDPQEIGLGQDTYCLVVDPGQATYYGGVRECELTANRLHLVLTHEAAATLGMHASSSFELVDLPEEKRQMLRRGLSRVLATGRPSEFPHRLNL